MEQRFLEIESQIPCIRVSEIKEFLIKTWNLRDNARVQSRVAQEMIAAV